MRSLKDPRSTPKSCSRLIRRTSRKKLRSLRREFVLARLGNCRFPSCGQQKRRKNARWREEIRRDRIFTSHRFLVRCTLPAEARASAYSAPVAQMDRVHASGAWGREFESHRARHFLQALVLNDL